jgi:hypothetical protein
MFRKFFSAQAADVEIFLAHTQHAKNVLVVFEGHFCAG